MLCLILSMTFRFDDVILNDVDNSILINHGSKRYFNHFFCMLPSINIGVSSRRLNCGRFRLVMKVQFTGINSSCNSSCKLFRLYLKSNNNHLLNMLKVYVWLPMLSTNIGFKYLNGDSRDGGSWFLFYIY